MIPADGWDLALIDDRDGVEASRIMLNMGGAVAVCEDPVPDALVIGGQVSGAWLFAAPRRWVAIGVINGVPQWDAFLSTTERHLAGPVLNSRVLDGLSAAPIMIHLDTRPVLEEPSLRETLLTAIGIARGMYPEWKTVELPEAIRQMADDMEPGVVAHGDSWFLPEGSVGQA